ncbi:MAG: hypothetical protein IJV61_06420 [Paludibacteraceae bacterium]|nr:hypothetical protein [Paludibacteraceae bacterium]
MKKLEVRISDEVFQDLVDFYDYNLEKHPALDEVTVLKKEKRLIEALNDLGTYALTDHKVTRHIPWARKGYKDYYFDGFHFGYRIETLPSGEKVVVVYEACHELLFY